MRAGSPIRFDWKSCGGGLLAALLSGAASGGETVRITDQPSSAVQPAAAVTQQPADEQPAAEQPPVPQPPGDQPPLSELEQLLQTPVEVPAMQQEVTTVSRQESTVGRSPAAVFVITNEMIRRSGATTIAEALRMVPGVNVARIDEANWAISIRGFQDRFANKLLVQIDGRTVYNPILSGVYWQLQDLLLQDVERIEVIRGPGATVWGSNAVNGIVNIITKSAVDTQGGLVTAAGGNMERGIAGARYGGRLGENAHYRVWGKWREHDHGFNPAGQAVEDWRAGRGGFRMDWTPTNCDTITVQGDLYSQDEGLFETHPIPIPPSFTFNGIEDRHFKGADVVCRWEHEIDDDSNWQIQLYYDYFAFNQSIVTPDINTFDADFQHTFPLADRHQLIYGIGYRAQDAVVLPSSYVQFGYPSSLDGFQILTIPQHRNLDYFSAFVQDEITLSEDWSYATLGCKFEDNPFVGFVYQPTARLLLTPSNRQSAWAAVSRGVRTPAIQEHNFQSTTFRTTTPPNNFARRLPNPDFQSEDVMAYELGYRAQPDDAFSWDVALFYNVYENLRVVAPTGVVQSPFVFTEFRNAMRGETYGVELMANLQMTECWRLYGAYSFLQMQLTADPTLAASTRAAAEGAENQSPQNQLYLWSSHDLGCCWELDLIGRYVDHLSGFANPPNDTPVPSYIQADVRLAYRPNDEWEFVVVGQNLLDRRHPEFGVNSLLGRPVVETQRGVYAMVTRTW